MCIDLCSMYISSRMLNQLVLQIKVRVKQSLTRPGQALMVPEA